MNRLTATILLLPVLGIPCAGQGDEMLGGAINVVITNPYSVAREVEAVDNVCGTPLFAKPMEGEASISVQICTRGMGRGDVSIRDLGTGSEQRYSDVLQGANLSVP